jgi:hypothetical protein
LGHRGKSTFFDEVGDGFTFEAVTASVLKDDDVTAEDDFPFLAVINSLGCGGLNIAGRVGDEDITACNDNTCNRVGFGGVGSKLQGLRRGGVCDAGGAYQREDDRQGQHEGKGEVGDLLNRSTGKLIKIRKHRIAQGNQQDIRPTLCG